MKQNKTDTAYKRFQEWERVARDDEEMIRIGLKRSKISLPVSAHTHSVSVSALLLFVVLGASLFFTLSPGVARGGQGGTPSNVSNPGNLNNTAQPPTTIELIQKGRFGLNAVASLLGLTKCSGKDFTQCGKPPDLRQVVLKLIQVALGFTSLIALIFVLYGGFVWITASGSSDKVNKGRDILIWAGIGLFVVMFAWGLVTYIIYTSSRVVA